MRSGMWVKAQARETLRCCTEISSVRRCIRMGARAGRGKYGTCCALPEPIAVRHSGSWGV